MLNCLSLILICAGSDLRGLAYKMNYFSLFDLETIYFLMHKHTRCVKNSSSNESCWLLKRETVYVRNVLYVNYSLCLYTQIFLGVEIRITEKMRHWK